MLREESLVNKAFSSSQASGAQRVMLREVSENTPGLIYVLLYILKRIFWVLRNALKQSSVYPRATVGIYWESRQNLQTSVFLALQICRYIILI